MGVRDASCSSAFRSHFFLQGSRSHVNRWRISRLLRAYFVSFHASHEHNFSRVNYREVFFSILNGNPVLLSFNILLLFCPDRKSVV